MLEGSTHLTSAFLIPELVDEYVEGISNQVLAYANDDDIDGQHSFGHPDSCQLC